MPAINLNDLENKIEILGSKLDNPTNFYFELRDLYEYYTDRTFRPNKETNNVILIPKYKILPQVQRSIRQNLIPHLINSPAQALLLAKELWKKEYYEYKEIAILIIGSLPFQKQINIIEILADWASEIKEEILQRKIASEGISTLIEENPEALIEWIKVNLSESKSRHNKFSFYCLFYFTKSNPKKHLPDILQILKEALSPPLNKFQYQYQEIIAQLNIYVPEETKFLLDELSGIYPNSKIINNLDKISN
jgi:hypothetical protein